MDLAVAVVAVVATADDAPGLLRTEVAAVAAVIRRVLPGIALAMDAGVGNGNGFVLPPLVLLLLLGEPKAFRLVGANSDEDSAAGEKLAGFRRDGN